MKRSIGADILPERITDRPQRRFVFAAEDNALHLWAGFPPPRTRRPAMPDAADVDLGYALKLLPAEAVEYFRDKGFVITDDWRELWQAAHTRAFTVAKMAKHDLLESTQRIVARSITGEMTSQQAAAVLKDELRKAGWWGKRAADGAQLGSARRIRTILRTNAATAYAAGRHQRQVESAGARPWWRYVAVMDGVTRLAHRQLHGKILRHDDPAWEAIYPPNGFNCRCRVVSMSERQAKAAFEARPDAKLTGEAPQTRDVDMVDRRTGEVFQRKVTSVKLTDAAGHWWRFDPDAGWGYRPGASVMPGTGSAPSAPANFLEGLRPAPMPRGATIATTREQAVDFLFAPLGITLNSAPTAVSTPVGPVVIAPQKLTYIVRKFNDHREQFAGHIKPTLEEVDEVREVFVDGERRWRFMKAWAGDKGASDKVILVITVEIDGKETVINVVPKRLNEIERQRGADTRLIYRRPPDGEEEK